MKTDDEFRAAFTGLTAEELRRFERLASAAARERQREEDDAFSAAHPFPADGSPSLAKGVTYSHVTRCGCGRGVVYANHAHPKESRGWVCEWLFFAKNDELEKLKVVADLGNGFFGRVHEAADGQKHRVFPFVSYEIKSEFQPSAAGISTRPGLLKPDPKMHGDLVCSAPGCSARFARETDHRIIQAHEARHRDPVKCPRCRDTGKKWLAYEEVGVVIETLLDLPCDDHVS